MSDASSQATSLLDRALAAASQNLRVEKLLLQIGLDPTHLTFSDVFNRVVDITLAHINFANTMALLGAIFFVATLMVRTIVPLRIVGIISNVFFICYGALAGAVPTFLLYLLSLPINVLRLRQMLNLVRKARVSAQGDLSMDWLRPFMIPRKYRAGEVLFHKGDIAKEMFLTVTGKFLVTEIGVELPPGRMMGELGFVDPKNRRTQTVQCIEDADVLAITYEKLLELYFQNPEFGYYFLRLTTERLMQNIARLEGVVEANQKDISRLEEIIEAGKITSPEEATPNLEASR
jgi:CRP-like cAMP-binding protein